ncbi:MAG: DsrE family protein [Planctomycetaceae bacterium]
MNTKVAFCILTLTALASPHQKDRFHPGKVILEFGKVASVESDIKLDASTTLKLCFDVADKSGEASINQTFNSAARFINLNIESGAAAKNIEVAIVVHGKAAIDVTNSDFYTKTNEGRKNHNAKVIAALQANRTTIYLCGQTAAARGIRKADLLPGVKMAPSAMTAHALLQQDDFALCPF